METFLIKCYGVSCNFWLAQSQGKWSFTTRKGDSQEFATETDAMLVGQGLFASGKIGHWEIIRKVS